MKITRKELKEVIEEVASELGILEVDEGNAFGAAVKKAKEAGEDEFEVDGKTYKVEEWADEDDARRSAPRQRIKPTYAVAEELTAKQKKLPKPLQAAILKKQGANVEEEEEDEEVAEGLSAAQEKLPEPLKKAILKKQGGSPDEDDEETLEESVEEFVGEDDDVEEGNAFGAAVKKAKEAGEDEFEVDGKTYKVEEFDVKAFSECTLSETFARISGNKKVLRG